MEETVEEGSSRVAVVDKQAPSPVVVVSSSSPPSSAWPTQLLRAPRFEKGPNGYPIDMGEQLYQYCRETCRLSIEPRLQAAMQVEAATHRMARHFGWPAPPTTDFEALRLKWSTLPDGTII